MRCSLTYKNLIYGLERCQLGGRTGGRRCIAFGFSTSTSKSNPNTAKGQKRRERNETRKKKGGKTRVRQEKNEGKGTGLKTRHYNKKEEERGRTEVPALQFQIRIERKANRQADSAAEEEGRQKKSEVKKE